MVDLRLWHTVEAVLAHFRDCAALPLVLQEEAQDIFGRMHGVWLANTPTRGPAAFFSAGVLKPKLIQGSSGEESAAKRARKIVALPEERPTPKRRNQTSPACHDHSHYLQVHLVANLTRL